MQIRVLQNYFMYKGIRAALETHNAQISFSTSGDVEMYDMSGVSLGKRNGGCASVSLQRTDGLFLNEHAVIVNGTQIGITERRAQQLFELAEGQKPHLSGIEKVM